jgi:hypothetical protein
MRNSSNKICTENQYTLFMFNDFFFVIIILWDNVEKQCTAGQATDGKWRMRNAY